MVPTEHPEFFKFLINNIDEVVAYHNADGTYFFVTPSCEKILGYTQDELIGKSPYDFMHPDDIEYIRKKFHEPILDGKEVKNASYRFLCKDKNYLWMQSSTTPITNKKGEVEHIISSSQDITDLMNLQEELKKNEALFSEAARLANLGAWELDMKTNMTHWTKNIYKIYGVDYDYDTSYENALKNIEPESRQLLVENINNIIENGGTYDLILKLISGDKKLKWVRAIGQSTKDGQGKTQRIYGVLQDITEEQETKKTLSRINQQMKLRNKQLQDFANIIAHNLRGPTNNLNVLIEYLRDANTEKERNEFFNLIQEVSGSIHRILEDMIQFVTIKAETEVAIETVHFSTVFENVMQNLHSDFLESKAKIETDFSQLPKIDYIKIYLESILYNLVSNALKYSHPSRPPHIMIRTYKKGEIEVLEVSDNGLGIDLKKHGTKMFKLHRTFHKEKKGKGFGLFMTRDQVISLGGRIEVESEVDQGTTFRVLFNEPETINS